MMSKLGGYVSCFSTFIILHSSFIYFPYHSSTIFPTARRDVR